MEPIQQKKKIMIVEDESSMLRILSDSFRREGFEVLEAQDGETAFNQIIAKEPDIILLDIVLPKMDGLSMLKKLRHMNTYGKDVPVILLTNLSPDREEINRTITETDPAYYLVKTNWNIEDVVAKVNERLG